MSSFWQTILGVSADQPLDGFWYFRFLSPWGFLPAFLVSIVLLGGILYCYRNKAIAMPWAARIAAVSARILLCAIILFMLWRPAITIETVLREEPVLIVLADKSLSMGIEDITLQDELITRNRAAGLLLKELNAIEELEAFDVHAFALGEEPAAAALEGLADQAPDERLSRIYANTAAVIERFQHRIISGVYIITDARTTGGGIDAEAFNQIVKERFARVPVHIVSAGNPIEQVDVRITDIIVPENVFAGEEIELMCRYQMQGETGQLLTVTLRENGTVIGDSRISPSPGGEVLFPYTPGETGEVIISCEIAPLPGETLESNNRKTQAIEVFEGKLNVLYIEGTPRWEFRYLKNSIIRDSKVRLSSLLVSADPGFRQEGDMPINAVPDDTQLQQYDIIIIGNVQASFFRDREMQAIAAAVEQQGTGILFMPGSPTVAATYLGTPLEALIPVNLLKAEAYSVFEERENIRPFRPEFPAGALEHPVLQLDDDAENNRKIWQSLPPLYSFVRTGGVKAGKIVLAHYPGSGSLKRQSVLFATGFYGLGKTFFAGIDSTWRWRFQAGDRFFYRFWLNIFRYLSSGRFAQGRSPCLVMSGKQVFAVGDVIPLKVLIRDRNFEPVTAPHWDLEVSAPDGTTTQVRLDPAAEGPGFFKGVLYPSRAGTYSVTMQDTEQNENVYRTLTVRLPRNEFRSTTPDLAGIKTALAGTAGKTFDIANPQQLIQHITALSSEGREKIRKNDIELFTHPLLYALLAFGLITEWLLRKIFQVE